VTLRADDRRDDRADPPGLAALALLLTVPLPMLGTTLAMVWYPDAVWAKALFFLAKLWLVAAPILYLVLIEKRRPRVPRWSSRGILAAHITGVVTFVAIVGVYLLVGRTWIDLEPVTAKAAQLGLDRWPVYLLGALYWCTVNSLLEEYFWRWFVFKRLSALVPPMQAVILSGGLFTLHHIVALSTYFDWRVTALASLGVFIGGVTWSWLYARYGNLYAAYISHVWADLAVFGVGAWLFFGS
jgi:hypothetical protein